MKLSDRIEWAHETKQNRQLAEYAETVSGFASSALELGFTLAYTCAEQTRCLVPWCRESGHGDLDRKKQAKPCLLSVEEGMCSGASGRRRNTLLVMGKTHHKQKEPGERKRAKGNKTGTFRQNEMNLRRSSEAINKQIKVTRGRNPNLQNPS